MLSSYDLPNILYIPDIETEITPMIITTTSTYDSLPLSLDTCPKITNLLCWSCTLDIETPVSIPCSDMDSTVGIFCSFNCAARYIDTHPNSNKWESQALLKLLYKKNTGLSIDHIVPAPSKTELKQYGGKLTPAEFKEIISTLNIDHKLSVQHSMIAEVHSDRWA